MLGGGIPSDAHAAVPFDCRTLDFGIYWYGLNNASQKAVPGVYNPYFNAAKPTVIYVHGWQKDGVINGKRETFNYAENDPTYGVNVNMADAWINAGWNIGIFYWNQFADETEVKNAETKIWTGTRPQAMRWRQCDGTYTTTGSPTVSAAQLFYNAITANMANFSGPHLRIVGHSLGAPPSSGDGGGPTEGEPLPGRDGGGAEEAEEGAGGWGRAAAQDLRTGRASPVRGVEAGSLSTLKQFALSTGSPRACRGGVLLGTPSPMHTSAKLTSDQQALNAHDVAVYEECLAYARSHARGAAEGLFGPGSMMWLLHRESVSLYPGLLRSVVMQVAHPTLNTAAFTGDTKLVRNVRARAAGTFRAMYEVVFGDLDSAIKTGLMTHRIHQSVWGMRTAPDGSAQQFRANDPELLLWVFATILNSEVVCFTEINRPLTPDEEARLWKEAKVLAAVIGIPPEHLPATWADFN
ncbi:MAG TPA: oxygenase MpaB family protein, partial [Archangium sp.]|nr:oxygenase MpaB family protein [Archangium sp.]